MQFPLVPAEAITIHKSQGQTYKNVCLDFTSEKNISLQTLYVALSRVKSLDDLYIVGNLAIPRSTKTTMKVNREIENLRSTKTINLHHMSLSRFHIKIVYQNINSLQPKIHLIKSDKWYSISDLLIFAEAKTKSSTKNIDINDYRIIYRQNTNDIKGKTTTGIICYIKNNLYAKSQIITSKVDFDHNSHTIMFLILIDQHYVVSGYKSPKYNMQNFFKLLKEIFELILSQNKTILPVVLIGDFNFDTIKPKSHFENFINSCSFIRTLPYNIPTTTIGSQIDSIFISNIENRNTLSGIYESYFSDHKPIFVGLDNTNISTDTLIEENNEKKEVNCPFRSYFSEEKSRFSQIVKTTVEKGQNVNIIDEKLPQGENLLHNYNNPIDNVYQPDNNDDTIDLTTSNLVDDILIRECEDNPIDRVIDLSFHLNDSYMYRIEQLAKNEFPGVYNIQSSLTMQRYKLVPPNVDDIQIIFDNLGDKDNNDHGHWFTIFRKQNTNIIKVYDSLNRRRLSYNMKQCILKLYRSTENQIFQFEYIRVQQQPELISCGVFAIAFFIDIIHGNDPSNIQYKLDANGSVSLLRIHLKRILDENRLLVFPRKDTTVA